MLAVLGLTGAAAAMDTCMVERAAQWAGMTEGPSASGQVTVHFEQAMKEACGCKAVRCSTPRGKYAYGFKFVFICNAAQ